MRVVFMCMWIPFSVKMKINAPVVRTSWSTPQEPLFNTHKTWPHQTQRPAIIDLYRPPKESCQFQSAICLSAKSRIIVSYPIEQGSKSFAKRLDIKDKCLWPAGPDPSILLMLNSTAFSSVRVPLIFLFFFHRITQRICFLLMLRADQSYRNPTPFYWMVGNHVKKNVLSASSNRSRITTELRDQTHFLTLLIRYSVGKEGSGQTACSIQGQQAQLHTL